MTEKTIQHELGWGVFEGDAKLFPTGGFSKNDQEKAWAFGWDTSVPADGSAGWAKGAIFIDHSAGTIYKNVGTVASSNFDEIPAGAGVPGLHAPTHLPSGTDPLTTAAAGTILPDASAAEGTAESFARSDHAHGITADVPVATASTNAEGSATAFARSDHVHETGGGGAPGAHAPTHLPSGADPLTTAVAGAIAPDDAAAEGTAESFARSDHTHSIVAAVAGAAAVGDTAAEGSATSFGRSDHTHAVSAGTPVAVGTANAAGSATTFNRSDHVHAARKAPQVIQWGTCAALATGDGSPWSAPMRYAGTILGAEAVVKTASTSGAITVDILKSTDNGANWTTIFSTKITIDVNERSTATAATDSALNVTSFAVDDLLRVNYDGVGTDAADITVGLWYKSESLAA